jgi:hypothetical protein
MELDRIYANHVYSFSIQEWRSEMATRTIALTLNQQQLELIDRTVANGAAPDRVSLIKLAVREQGAKAT